MGLDEGPQSLCLAVFARPLGAHRLGQDRVCVAGHAQAQPHRQRQLRPLLVLRDGFGIEPHRRQAFGHVLQRVLGGHIGDFAFFAQGGVGQVAPFLRREPVGGAAGAVGVHFARGRRTQRLARIAPCAPAPAGVGVQCARAHFRFQRLGGFCVRRERRLIFRIGFERVARQREVRPHRRARFSDLLIGRQHPVEHGADARVQVRIERKHGAVDFEEPAREHLERVTQAQARRLALHEIGFEGAGPSLEVRPPALRIEAVPLLLADAPPCKCVRPHLPEFKRGFRIARRALQDEVPQVPELVQEGGEVGRLAQLDNGRAELPRRPAARQDRAAALVLLITERRADLSQRFLA